MFHEYALKYYVGKNLQENVLSDSASKHCILTSANVCTVSKYCSVALK